MSARAFFEHLPDPATAPAVERFRQAFGAQADELTMLAARVTGTPVAHHREEMANVLATLQLLLLPRQPPHGCLFRARGRVLIGLPGNEPLAMPSVLACAGLLGGNVVQLRPATSTRPVVERLVALLLAQGVPDGRLTLLGADKALVEPAIRASDHVVWVGSSATCKLIAAQALAASVTFTTEAEGFDVGVVDETLDEAELRRAAGDVVSSVTCHDGQACRALRAVLVPARLAARFRALVDEAVARLRIGPAEDAATEATRLPEILESAALNFPTAVPFTSRLEIVPYREEADVVSALERNPFGLSVAFFTRRAVSDVLSGPAGHARVGRVLVNVPPRPVDPTVPWGGYRRTGSGPHDPVLDFVDVASVYRR
jgi:acyl-CoA reductase-like NAD-dependent aldehyde dehydrogenase